MIRRLKAAAKAFRNPSARQARAFHLHLDEDGHRKLTAYINDRYDNK